MNYTVKLIEKDTELPVNEIKSLWTEAFGDSEVFIDAVLSSKFYAGAVCAFSGSKVLGAAHLLRLEGDDEMYYCYAVATSEKHRNAGVGLAILEYIKVHCDKNDCGVLLHPASRSLSEYYKKRGFVPLSFRHTCLCHGDGGKYSFVSAAEYARMREYFFGGTGSYSWSEEALELSGLRFLAFDVDDQYCLAAVAEEKVYEVCACADVYGKAVRRAASYHGSATVFEVSDIPIDAECSVMGYNVKAYSYFNLFLE